MTGAEDAYDDEALAAEYVLHLLDAEARRAFEARLVQDRELQGLVTLWEARLAPLSSGVPEVAPPAPLRGRILGAVEPRREKRWALPFWPLALGGMAAAALVAFLVFGNVLPGQRPLEPAFQAELAAEDRSVVLIAGVIPATHEIVVDRIAGAPPEGRVHELWLIADGADAPVSLGVLDNAGTTRIRVPDDIAPGVRTGTIAISIEPPGGSPTGTPTGAVVATATFVDL